MLLSLPKSMMVCFTCLPFREAVKLPILVSYKTKILCLKKNSIRIDSPKRFGVKIGFGGAVILGDLWNRFDIHSTSDYKELIDHFKLLRQATE